MPDLVLDHSQDAWFRLTPLEKNQIIAKRLSGMPSKDIQAQHGVSQFTVWKLTKDLKLASEALARSAREEQAALAMYAVNEGLSDDSDNYKRAGIGVQVLKGLGVYQPDGATLAVGLPPASTAIMDQLTDVSCRDITPTSPHDTSDKPNE